VRRVATGSGRFGFVGVLIAHGGNRHDWREHPRTDVAVSLPCSSGAGMKGRWASSPTHRSVSCFNALFVGRGGESRLVCDTPGSGLVCFNALFVGRGGESRLVCDTPGSGLVCFNALFVGRGGERLGSASRCPTRGCAACLPIPPPDRVAVFDPPKTTLPQVHRRNPLPNNKFPSCPDPPGFCTPFGVWATAAAAQPPPLHPRDPAKMAPLSLPDARPMSSIFERQGRRRRHAARARMPTIGRALARWCRSSWSGYRRRRLRTGRRTSGAQAPRAGGAARC
jgi:hypothetical protein